MVAEGNQGKEGEPTKAVNLGKDFFEKYEDCPRKRVSRPAIAYEKRIQNGLVARKMKKRVIS